VKMKAKGSTILKGTGASSGEAKGEVCVLLTPEENRKIRQGEILVTRMTTPLFTPAIMQASAIVTDIGGYLSHAAIIARELGIPCVVGAKEATKVLSDGEEILVNGNEGTVKIF